MSEAFDSIKSGLKEAITFAEGKDIAARVFSPAEINVRALRQNIGMTQVEFAAFFGISINTLRHWEKGDRIPRGPALVLLNLIHKEPQTILKVLYR